MSESILLGVCSVPNPVHEEVRRVKQDQNKPVPVINGRCMVRQVDGAMTVSQRDACHVPEYEHKTPLLIIHIPESLVSSLFTVLI